MINIKDLGAVGDGKTNNMAVFNKAIPKDSKIVVPPGIYLTSPFRLRSGINLHLEKDAVILISDDFTHFQPVKSRWEGVECFGYCPCIYAENLQDISITGNGIIDGNGATWHQEFKKKRQGKIMPFTYLDFEFFKLNDGIDLSDCGGGGISSFFFRPPLIQFNNCRNVHLEGFTTRNSPFWNTHILYCKDVTIKNVTFQNPDTGINGDGLDIDSCNGVQILDCTFDVNDDCVCFKSGIGKDGIRVNKPCENVLLKNCRMLRGHGSVVMGSETAMGIRNIEISDCTFNGTDRGIRLKSRRGRAGTVENITLNNIIMNGVGCPIVMNLYYECGAKQDEISYLSDRNAQPVTATTPAVKNIIIKNVTANDAHSAASVFLGLPESPIENVLFENVKITMAKECKAFRPAMAFGMKEMKGEGLISDNVKNFIQRNTIIS
ncbi:MAG: glycoside hydrolase family 28 protein [Phycisphaerales bacterium]